MNPGLIHPISGDISMVSLTILLFYRCHLGTRIQTVQISGRLSEIQGCYLKPKPLLHADQPSDRHVIYIVIRQIKIPSGVTKTAFYYLS